MGMIGPDEPRYAEIGRSMAHSGDWITPHLWGEPWFEKPALLYWMTAAAFRAGLGPDLAPRLPVALLSVSFLLFYWWRLRREWNSGVATCATAILATSAGWLAYSHIAVPDLPLAVFFSAALLFACPWIARGEAAELSLAPAAACLGLAVLAKGLVPLVLFIPVPALGWRRIRDWLRPGPVTAFCVVALPWYILCTLRNGREFLRVFFLEHQFRRFSSPALQHVEPVWFYIPVLLLLLYPWFPLLALPIREEKDRRIRMLGAVVIFGFVFFSASVNKLPGYLMPLLPAACVVMGVALANAKRPWLAIIGPVTLLGALPVISGVLPTAIAHGLRSAPIYWPSAALPLISGCALGIGIAAILRRRAFMAAIIVAAAAFLWFQVAVFPRLDRAASARPFWSAGFRCAPSLPRSILYGLYYYANRELPDCAGAATAPPIAEDIYASRRSY